MPDDDQVRELVYDRTAAAGRPPLVADVSVGLGMAHDAVRESFERLGSRRLLALAPESREIVMAPPFSAVPTPFHVVAGGRGYFANCVWDAYGIAAALHRDADVATSCACCGEPMSLAVRDEQPVPTAGVAHFAVPAARWWDDIVHT